MDESRWWNYVLDVIREATAKEAADRTGIDKSNFTRWKQGGRPAVEFVLKFARAYGRPVVEALAAAGYITDAEASVREVRVGVEEISDVALAREILRRAEARNQAPRNNVTRGSFGERDRFEHLRTVDLTHEPLAASTDNTAPSPEDGEA